MNNNNERFKVITEIKKFIIYTDKIIINYPRKSYVLKDKIESTAYILLEYAYKANICDTEKVKYQQELISSICMLDFYLEISYQKKYITEKKLHQGSRILEAIKKLTYGWVKVSGS